MAEFVQARFLSVETRNAFYRTMVEVESLDQQVVESRIAEVCFEMAEVLKQGADLYESINRLDEDWRSLIFDKAVEYCPKFEARIERLYRTWHETSLRALELYSRIDSQFTARGYLKTDVDRLKAAVLEVTGILTDDETFFSGKKLAKLHDQALDDFKHGRTETAR